MVLSPEEKVRKLAEKCKSRRGDDGEICGLLGQGCTYKTCMIPAAQAEARKLKRKKP